MSPLHWYRDHIEEFEPIRERMKLLGLITFARTLTDYVNTEHILYKEVATGLCDALSVGAIPKRLSDTIPEYEEMLAKIKSDIAPALRLFLEFSGIKPDEVDLDEVIDTYNKILLLKLYVNYSDERAKYTWDNVCKLYKLEGLTYIPKMKFYGTVAEIVYLINFGKRDLANLLNTGDTGLTRHISGNIVQRYCYMDVNGEHYRPVPTDWIAVSMIRDFLEELVVRSREVKNTFSRLDHVR